MPVKAKVSRHSVAEPHARFLGNLLWGKGNPGCRRVGRKGVVVLQCRTPAGDEMKAA